MKEIPLVVNPLKPGVEAATFRAVLDRTLGLRFTRVAGALPRFPKAYRAPLVDWIHRRAAFGAKTLERLLGEVTLPDLYRKVPNDPVRVVWKSIESVGRIGLIARLAPEFRIIHILRHPCGWMESVTRGHRENRFSSDRNDWWIFKSLEASPPGRRRGLTMASFQAMSELERETWLWVLWNESGTEGCEGLANVMTVRYEDVCAAPIEQSHRMFDFARLEWHAQTEHFVRRSVSEQRKGYYSLFRDPNAAANKWREMISARELGLVESILRQSELGRMFLTEESPLEEGVPEIGEGLR